MLENHPLEKRINYVLDTSALISNPKLLEQFESCTHLIPMEVLQELDNLKTRSDHVGKNARYVNRFLDQLRQQGSLFEGVIVDEGVTVKVVSKHDALLPIFEDTVDNRIISTAFHLSEKIDVVCLSNDIAFRVKCDAIGLKAESVDADAVKVTDSGYTGFTELEVSNEIIEAFYEDGYLDFEDVEFFPNQGVLLVAPGSTALCVANGCNTLDKLEYTKGRKFNVEGVTPRNKEQTIALELLLDPDIPLVTLNGIAGCGKTLLAIASAMSQHKQGLYKKIIISRPIESTSNDIGFLPGTKEEKMAPWVQPIFDNLEVLYRKKGLHYIELMMQKGHLEIEAISHIRGRSLPDTIFIVDEAQNITRHEAKALLTRMGERSKIVLIGDLDQIDSPKLSHKNSGLSVIIEAFKDTELAGHVKLLKGERSALATYAATVL
jgi:PhoH-like ATPase